ncbi:MAG: two-component regulator propeller domain-containing protein, partial [Bacteroidota bacterium]
FANTTISGMPQDIEGNIWIASNNQGLYRYNGDDYKLYSHQRDNPNSLISDRLECIYAAKSGHIWIGSFANGLSRLDPATDSFTNFTQNSEDPTSIRSNAIRRITEDNEGRIWVASLSGLDYYDPTSGTFKRDFQEGEAAATLSKAHIRTLYLDKSGILWAGASSPFFGEQSEGGLYRIDPEERSVKRYHSNDDSNSLNNDIVTAILEDSRGVFWVGTAGDGLHTMDRELGKFQRHLNVPGQLNQLSRPPVKGYNYALDHIRFIEEDKFGNIWIGTFNNGINVFNPKEGTIIHMNDARKDQYDLPVNDFWSALKTKDGLLWLGAWSPGDAGTKLLKVNLSPVELGFVELGSPVYSFVDAERGSLYIGSETAIGRINPRDGLTNYHILDKEGIERVSHLSRSGDEIWACTEKGLLYYDPILVQHQLYPLYDKELAVGELLDLNATALLSPDSVLVASSNGLFLFDHNTEEFTPIKFKPDYMEERTPAIVNLVYIDTEKRIWVGFDIHGLQLLQSDLKTFKDYRFLPNVQDGPEVIKEDKNKTLYVGNWRSGLKVYNAEQDTFFQLADQN